MSFSPDSADRSCKTEICNFVPSFITATVFRVFLEKNILGFDIPMYKILFMN